MSKSYQCALQKASTKNIVLFCKDITELKHIKDGIHENATKIHLIMNAGPDKMAYVDAQQRLRFINKRYEEWYAPEPILGKHVQEFMGALDYQKVQGYIEAVLSGEKVTYEISATFNDGKERYLIVDYVPHISKTGEVLGFFAVYHDITEHKQAEEELQQQAKRERLVAAMQARIRQSLNLEEVLNTTVVEVKQFLQTDRVLIYRFQPNQSSVVVESVEYGWPSIVGKTVVEPDVATYLHSYEQGHIRATQDIYTADLTQHQIELLAQFQVRSKLVVPIRQEDKLWGLLIAHHCSGTRQWQQFEIDLLQQLVTPVAAAIAQAQLYEQTQYQLQREQALNRVTQTIRSSLDLETVFYTAIHEIGNLLQVDHVKICQYLPQQTVWLTVAHYRKSPDLPINIGEEIPDEGNEITARLKQLQVVRIDDSSNCENKVTRIAHPSFGAWLLVPLQFRSSPWGSLCLLLDNRPYHWQDSEVELACAIAEQLMMAIQQSEFYHQMQRLNTDLEYQVQERTAQLQQVLKFEAMLKRVTDKVRDSLDEGQILQSAVRELAQCLRVNRCNTALYNALQTTATISYEYTSSLTCLPTSGQGVVQMEDLREVFHQLLQGQYLQFCEIIPHPIWHHGTILACPIFDDQGVLGDLWLLKHKDDVFNELEIRLVQQVANQCAIAIRQARLYQAVQAQVEELAKLNRLKDDFLSTISHELRTPMVNIKMAVFMLTVAFNQDSAFAQQTRVHRYLQILQDESAREISLINDLLDLQRLEAGNQTLALEKIHLQTWLLQVIEPFQEQFREQQQTFRLDIPPTLPHLISDLSSLGRILVELLSNACKYTPPGEQIAVTAEYKPGLIQLKVSNSGTEIPSSEIPRIFNKFYRIPSTDPWKQSGTGLGLALVQKLTENLGVTIKVDSASNQTCFTIELPMNISNSVSP